MSTHPDADALVRVYLRRPADVTPLLVFSDWLEETGTPWNIAWANYIRAKAEAGRYESGSKTGIDAEKRAAAYDPVVRATITVDAARFVNSFRSFLTLLPAPNITVRLAGFDIHLPVFELVPESVARENVVLPIGEWGQSLLVVTTDPRNRDTIQKLELILNKDIVGVRGETEDILAAINRHYGQTETVSVDCVLYESPLIGLQDHPASGSLFSIFYTAFSERATGFGMRRTGAKCSVQYQRGSDLLRVESYPRQTYDTLLQHLRSLTPTAECRKHDLRCVEFDIPLLGGRDCPATLEYQRSWRRPKWFRLRFRW